MERIPAVVRSTTIDGRTAYDIPCAWADGRVVNGVRFTSTLFVRAETDVPPAGGVPGQVDFGVYLPGRSGAQQVTLKWGAKAWRTPIPGEAGQDDGLLVSVVSAHKLVVWAELVAGKA